MKFIQTEQGNINVDRIVRTEYSRTRNGEVAIMEDGSERALSPRWEVDAAECVPNASPNLPTGA